MAEDSFIKPVEALKSLTGLKSVGQRHHRRGNQDSQEHHEQQEEHQDVLGEPDDDHGNDSSKHIIDFRA